MINWQALQVPRDKENRKIFLAQHGVKVKYFAGGTWKADASRPGAPSRHPSKHSSYRQTIK